MRPRVSTKFGLSGRKLGVEACAHAISALRSLRQENHKFKVNRLHGKLQTSPSSQKKKM